MEDQAAPRPAWKRALDTLLTTVLWILVIYVIVSWIPAVRDSGVGATLETFVGPILAPVRFYVPPAGGVDFSVVIVYILLRLFQGRFLRR